MRDIAHMWESEDNMWCVLFLFVMLSLPGDQTWAVSIVLFHAEPSWHL